MRIGGTTPPSFKSLAMQENEKKEGIILRLTPQKEADAMVNAISPDGFFSFYAKGIRKLSSKNAPAVQPLCHGEYDLFESSQGNYSLREAHPLEMLMKEGDLSAMAVCSFCLELTLQVVQEDVASEVYPWLFATLEAVKKGKEPLTVGLIYFAHVLNFFGCGLDVDQCVFCGRKTGIVAISYEDGGYVCSEDFDPEVHEKTPVRTLQILRYIFRCGLKDVERVSFDPAELLPLYSRLGQHLYDSTGIRLKSLDLLQRI